MFWLDERDESRPAPHVCGAGCTLLSGGSWLCRKTGAVLGPALAAPVAAVARAPSRSPSTSPEMRSRFMTATQQLLRRLVCSDRRKSVERTRAEKARTMALRAAHRSATADAEAGLVPNAGLALCAALSTYERVTCALEAESALPADVEAVVVAAGGDFFAAHLQARGARRALGGS